jgi:predicted permease
LALIATYCWPARWCSARACSRPAPCFRDGVQERAVLAMGAAFSNSVQLGIPLVLQAFGDAGLVQLMLIVSFHSATLITLATVVIEGARDGGRPSKSFALAVRSIVTNPIILAMFAGIGSAALGWSLPGPVDRFVALIASGSAACALFAMGASLAQFKLGGSPGRERRGRRVQAAGAADGHLAHRPLRVRAGAPAARGRDGVRRAAERGQRVHLAQRYGVAVERSVNLIVLSTLASLVTVSVLLAILRRQ